MTEILKIACEFALAGVMLAITCLACGAVLAAVSVVWHVSEKAYIKVRAHIRCRRAAREFNEKYTNEKVDIHVL